MPHAAPGRASAATSAATTAARPVAAQGPSVPDGAGPALRRARAAQRWRASRRGISAVPLLWKNRLGLGYSNQGGTVKIYLVDGPYELFRSHFGAPPRTAPDGREVGATLGLLRSLLLLLTTPGVTHVACAFDHVIESFRNGMYPGYKTGAGVDSNLIAQFSLAEEAVAALGLVVWPMVEFEADDALSSATARFKNNAEVEQIVICSPDKDLAQLISGNHIVGWDRRRNILIDEAGVV